ncbi:ComEC/Rec2 family competence protein [Clostridium sp. MB40-C1]|uniref:ComEC/Rec2 family competence protein n=1 Tax=Clostridium sp. MB40-C1 TaxID=3070996 RepID=UPI0027E1A3A7|nr:ComEC/Rec2 family competence protein [Clostridium sp. MB40-C1]WMJ82324.1 ComEC/Rec2 family competence protein [Clostridium sp. MB40-C1]
MKRPLIYYSISVFLGAFIIIVFEYNIFLGAAVAASFFSVIFFTLSKKEVIILCLFFAVGGFSFYNYYNISLPNEGEFRLVEKRRRYCIAHYKGRIVYLSGNLKELSNGEKVRFYGKFKKEADYEKGSVGIYNVDFYKNPSKDFVFKLYNLKEKLFEKYSKLLGKDKASLIMSICYGETKYLSFHDKENFKELGISHIISVSGFHMALVYSFLQKIFGIEIGLILSFMYLLFTGAKAATIRAYIMILILKLSKVVYRNYDSLSALALSALILLIIRPYYITNIGFALSFLATLGIILYNKKIQKALYKLPKKINESLSITLSSQVFSMPYVMCALNEISIFFIPANLILIPLYSLLIFAGNIGVVLINIPILKNIAISTLYSLTTTIQGANYLLLKISPPVYKYNYFYGIALLSIVMSYIFYKHEYKQVKYFPLVLLSFIIIYNMI